MNQEYTSKDTSINTITRVYKTVDISNKVILDYGGGKYDTNKEYVSQFNSVLYVYDPFNRKDDENAFSIQKILENNGADIVVCANVLNVIKEDEIIKNILIDLFYYLKKNGIIYIQIYEGNKSGIGTVTSRGYQRNQKTQDYLDFIDDVYKSKSIIRHGNIITVSDVIF